ncbi:peptide-methionine (S)-S-oxide reductase MsrA [Candidatus Mycobacterium wuenschmannii]|uniref:Peptide methionine sulfoxide reductase MsrA n=1 Tax=Candidatus Mycobacterium wuenschmannii TaxID=3027808 RepID=A0ABY8W330_9MYCO|nr:peptide-methionine (S)-S-oxide reductase MsrA [Candidatus Mycobacterium wuenschmannii]WIM88179.1 peptide-methionine (S)-S-oxide reductase MsrA [Candidatus Mycobacterium wuenschmannii]
MNSKTTTGRQRMVLASWLAVIGVAGAVFLVRSPAIPAASGTTASALPAPAIDEPKSGQARTETAVLAGGCFWGVQGVYQHVKGVTSAESGYAGGDAATANYDTVSSETTGHAESVRITYDPTQITFGQLLQVFFGVVQDPTELNYQGPDVGPSYRSVVFAQNDGQAKIANAYIAQLNGAGAFSGPIVTTVTPGAQFFPAEAYHQNYLNLHPNNSYIVANDLPKIGALKADFPDLYRD